MCMGGGGWGGGGLGGGGWGGGGRGAFESITPPPACQYCNLDWS